MFVRRFRIFVSFRRVLAAFVVLSLSVMFGRRPVALGGILVMFGCFGVRILGHVGLLAWVSN
jgi:hypothetical protein